MGVGPFYQRKSIIAANRRSKDLMNAKAKQRREEMEEEITRRVAIELWKRDRLEEEYGSAV
jgi:hypothetical protein